MFSKETIPSGGGVVRSMVATPDGKLYLACGGVIKVAVVNVDSKAAVSPKFSKSDIEGAK
jgi:hypothetical protein